MKKNGIWKVLAVLLIFVFVISACGAKSDASSGTDQFTTSSGFVCPPPSQKMEVTSKELNLFVWTEYIPTEWKECFEHVYNIKINHDEYSSNEELASSIVLFDIGGVSNLDVFLENVLKRLFCSALNPFIYILLSNISLAFSMSSKESVDFFVSLNLVNKLQRKKEFIKLHKF